MNHLDRSSAPFAEAISRRAVARLRAFRMDVERALPGQVGLVVFFGSRARQTATPASDYDVAVLHGDGATPPPQLGYVLSDLAYAHVRAGIPIRAIALPASTVNASSTIPIARNIASDGIEIV